MKITSEIFRSRLLHNFTLASRVGLDIFCRISMVAETDKKSMSSFCSGKLTQATVAYNASFSIPTFHDYHSIVSKEYKLVVTGISYKN